MYDLLACLQPHRSPFQAACQEQLSASHERRNSQLSEQLAAKRQEVAILKEHLQTKSEELKLALKAREEPPTDALAQLRAELASEQSASEVWKAQEARVAAQVTELSSSAWAL